jgi:hypothetical protein
MNTRDAWDETRMQHRIREVREKMRRVAKEIEEAARESRERQPDDPPGHFHRTVLGE